LFLAAVLSLAVPFLFASTAFAGGTAQYTIRPGDSFYGIAARYEITVAQLMGANPDLTLKSVLKPGQVITLPAGRGEGLPKNKPSPIYFWVVEKNGGRVEKSDHMYLVTNGDNFYRIASKFGLTFNDLVAANPQASAAHLLRGELVHIPVQKLGEGNYYYLFYETPRKAGGISR
jgi:LysM repeat protein